MVQIKFIPILIGLLFCSDAIASNYYVATDGSGDFTTIAQVNAQTFSAGDNIYFRRGDTWREQLVPDSGSVAGHITYSAYGNGDKPLLLGSTEENETSDWTDEGSNIWSNNDATFTVDVGNIIFDGGPTVGIKQQSEGAVDSDLEFWYDFTNDLIKVYSSSNPASRFTDIECALQRNIVAGLPDYVIFENLDLRYGARHGFGFDGGTDNIIIRDCDFSYLGGGDQYSDYTVRLGNGVEFWRNASNHLVERCKFDNIYDAAMTYQSTQTGIGSNIIFRNNKTVNCENAFEYWNRQATSTTDGIYFLNNTCVNSGYGWSHNQRWRVVNGRTISFENNDAVTSNVVLKNNIFYRSTESTITWTRAQDVSKYILDNNCFYKESGYIVAIAGEAVYKIDQLADYQSATSQDANSIALDPLFDGSNYALKANSPCVNAGVALSEVTHDYRRLLRSDPPEIGAMELGGATLLDGVTIDGVIFN